MKEFYKYSCTFESLNITPLELINASGNYGDSPDELILKIATEVISKAPDITNIEAGILLKPIEVVAEKLKVENLELHPGEKIAGYMRKAEFGAFFIATAGDGLETIGQHELMDGDMLKGYYFDLLGSLTVEKAMDNFQKEFKQELVRNGYQISNRYSPGYCNWNVADQKHLFSLFNEVCCNVMLNESALMLPVKSISGIIGIGSNIHFLKHNCNTCSSTNCIYKMVKSKEI